MMSDTWEQADVTPGAAPATFLPIRLTGAADNGDERAERLSWSTQPPVPAEKHRHAASRFTDRAGLHGTPPRNRRATRNYECLPASHEATILQAMIALVPSASPSRRRIRDSLKSAQE